MLMESSTSNLRERLLKAGIPYEKQTVSLLRALIPEQYRKEMSKDADIYILGELLAVLVEKNIVKIGKIRI